MKRKNLCLALGFLLGFGFFGCTARSQSQFLVLPKVATCAALIGEPASSSSPGQISPDEILPLMRSVSGLMAKALEFSLRLGVPKIVSLEEIAASSLKEDSEKRLLLGRVRAQLLAATQFPANQDSIELNLLAATTLTQLRNLELALSGANAGAAKSSILDLANLLKMASLNRQIVKQNEEKFDLETQEQRDRQWTILEGLHLLKEWAPDRFGQVLLEEAIREFSRLTDKEARSFIKFYSDRIFKKDPSTWSSTQPKDLNEAAIKRKNARFRLMNLLSQLESQKAEQYLTWFNENQLISAAASSNSEVFKNLFEESGLAHPDLKDSTGKSLVIVAAQGGNEKVVDYLIRNFSLEDLDDGLAKDLSPLIVASFKGRNAKILETILDLHPLLVALDGRPFEGELSLLYIAAFNGYDEIVKVLIKRIPVDKLNLGAHNSKQSPLYGAALNGKTNVVLELLKVLSPTQIMARNVGQWSALQISASRGHPKIVSAILDALAAEKSEAVTKMTQEAFFEAIFCGHTSVVRIMLEKLGGDLAHTTLFNGQVPIQVAIQKGHVETARVLFKALRSLPGGHQISNGSDLLVNAIQKGKNEMLLLLVSELDPMCLLQVDLNARKTPLALAISTENLKILQIVLNALTPEQIASQERYGKSALKLAAETPSWSELMPLIENKLLEGSEETSTAPLPPK